MNLRVFLFLFMLLSPAIQMQAQKIMLLEETTRFKRIRFYEGDKFAFRVDNEKYSISGHIDLILDDAIVVDDELYRYENITMVLNFKKYAVLRALSKSALIALPPMLVYTLLHHGINGEGVLLDRNSLQVMGVFAAIGVGLMPFKARKYPLGKKWQLRTIDVTPG